MKINRKMTVHIIALFCAISILTFVNQIYSQERPRVELTRGSFTEEANFDKVIKLDMGYDYKVGDWNDLRAIRNIERWIRDMRLENKQQFMLTRGGQYELGWKGHYFVQYFADGRPEPGFTVHDKIGNRLFLGSKNGINAPILIVRTGGNGRDEKPRMENERFDKGYQKDAEDKFSNNRFRGERIEVTSTTFSEKGDLNRKVKKQSGDNYSIADWNDLKSIKNIDEWIRDTKIRNKWKMMVTRDGNYTSSGNRQYFVQYFANGRPEKGFLVHDKIGDKLYLGSWSNLDAHILVKRDR